MSPSDDNRRQPARGARSRRILPAHWYTDPAITEREIDADLPQDLELHRPGQRADECRRLHYRLCR